MKFTKEYIIDYIKNVYITTGKIPQERDFTRKQHPFSTKTAIKTCAMKWSQILETANIPLTRYNAIEVVCDQCKSTFKKRVKDIKNTNHNFCSRSCAGTYTNTHRTTGNRVSKLELFLQNNLKGYNFDFNNRKICNGYELDIYIDSLKLAIEINGKCHRDPIYGQQKLEQIIYNDKKKQELCKEKNINLCIIDDMSNNFTIKHGEIILTEIYHIIHKTQFNDVLNQIFLFKE